MKTLYISIFLFVQSLTLLHAQHANISNQDRERFVQKATELRQLEDYNGAVQQLDSILLHNPVDAPILLFKGDLLLQGKRFANAAATYKQLLPLQMH